MISPLLWAKVARGLSAGRVQSVAVRLIVEREREIRAFVPEEYWEVFADLLAEGESAPARFQVHRGPEGAFRPNSEAETEKALEALRDADFVVRSREDKPTTTRLERPSLRQRCSRPRPPAWALASRKP